MKKVMIVLTLAALLAFTGQAFAHSPLMSCFDNGDGTVTCEGGFSDGSSANGVKVHVTDGDGKTVLESKMNEDSECTFKKPEGAYSVMFDAGEGHRVQINGADIVE
jgi:type 1 fimbria pilin